MDLYQRLSQASGQPDAERHQVPDASMKSMLSWLARPFNYCLDQAVGSASVNSLKQMDRLRACNYEADE